MAGRTGLFRIALAKARQKFYLSNPRILPLGQLDSHLQNALVHVLPQAFYTSGFEGLVISVSPSRASRSTSS
jgi:hypothetical protein